MIMLCRNIILYYILIGKFKRADSWNFIFNLTNKYNRIQQFPVLICWPAETSRQHLNDTSLLRNSENTPGCCATAEISQLCNAILLQQGAEFPQLTLGGNPDATAWSLVKIFEPRFNNKPIKVIRCNETIAFFFFTDWYQVLVHYTVLYSIKSS